MGVVSKYISLDRANNTSEAWRLLRSQNSSTIIAILSTHFDDQSRRIEVSELASLVEIDIQELRLRCAVDINYSGGDACEKWRRSGYLIRKPVKGKREETYELSSGAMTAISFAEQIVAPKRTATQSRLTLVMDAVRSLAIASSKDIARRKALLLAERQQLNAEIEKLEAGDIEVIDETTGIEQLDEILTLINEIPRDFARVKNDFHALNSSLFKTIVGYGDGHEDILEDIFAGIDRISQSPSGRSFKGFYSLLRDIDSAESLRDDIDAILEAPFATTLSNDERAQLHGMLRRFLEQSADVNEARLSLSRGLQRFVQSQQYQTDRKIKKNIDQALSNLHEALERYPAKTMVGEEVALSSISIKPISRYSLKSPQSSATAPLVSITASTTPTLSIEDLKRAARETDIDFNELAMNINELLSAANSTSDSHDATLYISDILNERPATQGIASVVGLISLILEFGRKTEGVDIVRWKSKCGHWKTANIERYEFYREVHP